MKISWLKYEKDKDSFKLQEALGLDVYKIPDLEDSDKKIEELAITQDSSITSIPGISIITDQRNSERI